MTATEKAKELVEKFTFINCTIFAVDEIIDELKREPYTNYERIVFWKAVKHELNKL